MSQCLGTNNSCSDDEEFNVYIYTFSGLSFTSIPIANGLNNGRGKMHFLFIIMRIQHAWIGLNDIAFDLYSNLSIYA